MNRDSNARFDGTSARQLAFEDFEVIIPRKPLRARMSDETKPGTTLRLMQKDVYAELTRRRRRAQMAARKYV